ncbi:MAG TPA: FUSC family protein [Gemmatimonadaceae bacterium]
MSLAGLNGSLIDRGGPYRTRAKVMSMLALLSAVTAFVGTLVSGHLALSVVVTFAIALLCGLFRAWTDVGPGFGVTVLVTFAIAVAVPSPTIGGAAMRAVYIAIGGLWAMFIAIVLWPIRPYRPVRLRVADCYRAIAAYVDDVSEEIERDPRHDPWKFKAHRVAVRTALENARTSLAVSRRGRSGETGRGERLLILHEIADQLFAHLIALLEVSETLPASEARVHRALRDALQRMAPDLRAIASVVESEIDLARVVVSWNGVDVRTVTNASERPFDAQVSEILDRMSEYASTAAAIASSLNSGLPIAQHDEVIEVEDPPPMPVLFSLRAILHVESVVLHHGLRVAIVATAAVFVAGLMHLNHGYWVTLTAVVILQPFGAATRQKAMQRVAGTILGGMVAAALSALFHNAFGVLILVAIFTTLCIALLPLNYGAYAVFGTPAFVLLAESSAGDWHLAGLRIINTLIGGALALVGAAVLWPGDEWNRLPEFVSRALRANDEYLRKTLDLLAGGDTDIGPLRDARRAIAQAAANADDSFQRLLSEHRGPPERLEPIMAVVVYVRRLSASTAALSLSGYVKTHIAVAEIAPFASAAHDILADLADAVAQSRPPKAFPAVGTIPIPDQADSPILHRRLTRLARQIKLMHDAVSRWMTPGGESLVLARTGEYSAIDRSRPAAS